MISLSKSINDKRLKWGVAGNLILPAGLKWIVEQAASSYGESY